MEKGLKFGLMLSLKEIALRRVAVLLSIDFQEIPECSCNFNSDWVRWINTHEGKVKYKISKLLLPESLKEEMIDKVRSVTLEIRKWKENHQWMDISAGEIDIPAKLFWTPAGTIDYKRTAEALLGCEVLDVEKRYTLACSHCLEDYIPLLWEELVEGIKEDFLLGISVFSSLEFCWPYILKGEVSKLDCLWRGSDRNLTSFNQWAFEESVEERYKMVAECFFLKLTPEERETSVLRTTLIVLSDCFYGDNFLLRYDALCFLLSLMTPEQQLETIKEHPVPVLLSFYVMFYQDLLVENAGVIWTFLRTSGYDVLSEEILCIARQDIYHPKSFQEFFKMSPPDFKKYFVHEYGEYGNPAARFLDTFIYKEDSDSIKSIFRNVDVADRVAIIFNPNVLYLLAFRQDDFGRMVEVCLREARLCKEDRERLKKERPYLRRVIEELYESDVTVENGQKHKLENYS